MRTVKKVALVAAATLCISVIYFAIPIVGQDWSILLFLPSMQKEEIARTQSTNVVERLPLYTKEELAQIRGIAVNPGDPGTLYFPPGIESFDQLPICTQVADDSATAADEHQQAYEQGLADGSHARGAQSRVLQCRIGIDEPGSFRMTPEEYEKWWLENGKPIAPDPITDHPDGPLYNQP